MTLLYLLALPFLNTAILSEDCLMNTAPDKLVFDEFQRFSPNHLLSFGAFGFIYKFKRKELGLTPIEGNKYAIVKVARERYDESMKHEIDLYVKLKPMKLAQIPNYHYCFDTPNHYKGFVVDYAGEPFYPPKYSKKQMNALKYEMLKKNYLEFYNKTPQARIRDYVSMVEALGELHEHKYAHCDFKPENILLSPNGKIILVDLGSAVEDSQHCKVVTTLFLDKGSVDHFEYLENLNCPKDKKNPAFEKEVDTNSWKQDIYALAITIFKLENSFSESQNVVKKPWRIQRSYEEADVMQIIEYVHDNMMDRGWIDDRGLNVSDKDGNTFESVFMKMSAYERKDRTLTAKDVAKALKKIADDFKPVDKKPANSLSKKFKPGDKKFEVDDEDLLNDESTEKSVWTRIVNFVSVCKPSINNMGIIGDRIII
jgi:serine/threonine protein kinase